MITGDVDYQVLSSIGSSLIPLRPILDLFDHLLGAARDNLDGPQKKYVTGFYLLNKTARVLSFIEWYSQLKGFPNFLADGDLIVPLRSQTAGQMQNNFYVTTFQNSPGSFVDANHVSIIERSE